MATIIDVARLAGVSVSTVSHVVNGTRPVRPATSDRVRAAVAAVGYSTDGVARALRRAQTECIGLVVTDTGQPGFAEMIRGVEGEATAAGFTLLLADSAEDLERQLASVAALVERRVDGLLLAQVSRTPRSLVESLVARGVRLVLIDRLSTPDVDQVGVETIEPMKTLVRHLIDRGHTRIALIAGDDAIPTLRERREGYVEAMVETPDPDQREAVAVEVTTPAEARAAVHGLFAAARPPTALVAASQLIAVGTLQALADLKLRIPGDVAVAVFDDFPHADLFRPRLTSVVQPNVAVGREAVRLLVRRIQDPRAAPRTIRLKAEIAHRESCGCPPGAPVARADMPAPDPPPFDPPAT
ncbi:MAG: LacI family transcriptional regulator [Chloroflexota bacterium]|nr:LacI family transcriptional regulator [Chloroflexota bacterium]